MTGLSTKKPFRLRHMLVQIGMARQAMGTKRYTFGPRMLRLAGALQVDDESLLTARDALDLAQDRVDERGNLDSEDRALDFDTREWSRRVQISARLSARFLLRAGAIPKVSLAFSGEASIDAYSEWHPMPQPFTSNCDRSTAELRGKLRVIRRPDGSVSDGDMDEGVCAFGVSIIDRQVKIFAGHSVGVPTGCCTWDGGERLQYMAIEAGERVSPIFSFVAVPRRWVVA